jgi:hypothetical protein
MMLGFAIALAVNVVPRMIKGPVIFFSLIPMLITPLVGALILFWMLNSDGVLGVALQTLFNDPNLSTRTSAPLTWLSLIIYGTWTNAPFSFNASANATSLAFDIFSSLNTQTAQLFGSAAATSVITIAFIAVLIMPVLARVARELQAGRV